MISHPKDVIFNNIGTPIEHGPHTEKGKPWAVLRHGRPLTKRQQALLDKLPECGSRAVVKKSDVSMNDLAALTAKEQVEFAMFTRGAERLVVRGDRLRVYISPAEAIVMRVSGYKWSGHTHVKGLLASIGDKEILKQFSQMRSAIYDSMGDYNTF